MHTQQKKKKNMFLSYQKYPQNPYPPRQQTAQPQGDSSDLPF